MSNYGWPEESNDEIIAGLIKTRDTLEAECHKEHDKNVGLTDRIRALAADRDQISLTLDVAKADRDKWFNRARDLEAALARVQKALALTSPVLWKSLKAEIDSVLTPAETACVHRWYISNTATQTCYACGATQQGNGPIEPSTNDRGSK